MNKGIKNEDLLIKALNGKKVYELNNNLSFFMRNIFKNCEQNIMIEAGHCQKGRKPDIFVKINKEIHYISIKYGTSETIHEESIITFVTFLLKNNISTETIKTILFFHFGDGTIDGTGTIRYGYIDVIYKLKEKILKANEELNNPEFILKTAKRFLFIGRGKEDENADILFHGNENFSIFCNYNQIMQYLKTKSFRKLNSLHIGPFIINPKARYIDFNENKPENRYKISIKWPRIIADLQFISNRYNY